MPDTFLRNGCLVSRRGQGLYDWWSRHRNLFSRLYDIAFLGRESERRERAMNSLSLDSGDRVLELGCGPGNSFEALRTHVGSAGRVVGLDYSPGMARQARRRARDRGWANVHVLRGDAGRPGIADGAFDAVYASMSLSAMPEPEQAIEAAYRALRPGGRIVVLDAQPFQQFPWTLLNPVIVPLAKWATNWFPDTDVPAQIADRFASTRIATFDGGVTFIAIARKSERTGDFG
ncbi:class I SAM-dependent methyltransferase [Halococcus morrhuae DSM 1307]|uniref:class I SAM-dependent methyltransferase n=1 Tax=Halococcus morrhuae TaxID=2250 RepID=UPI001EF9DDC1|nr:methyltransferase domain-containing protein [Halococcus morrhuae]